MGRISNQKGLSPILVIFGFLLAIVIIGGVYYLGLQKGRQAIINLVSRPAPNSTSQIPGPSTSPLLATPIVVNYPIGNFFSVEGSVYIDPPASFLQENSFTLVLTKTEEKVLNKLTGKFEVTKKYPHKISLPKGIDSVSDPTVGYQAKYGCVTLQSSGFVGSYVFNIETGKGLDMGNQYSKCLSWIDQSRVLIYEKLYNTNTATYYIFNAATKQKSVISTVKTNYN